MSKVKFHDDYQVGEHVFTRNSIWDFVDKYETLLPVSCDNACERFVFMYRIKTDCEILLVNGDVLVEIDHIINKDYTEEEWRKFITDDALVKDGDYVQAWINTFGINKPVKDSQDQCDYAPGWRRLNKEIEKKYGTITFG